MLIGRNIARKRDAVLCLYVVVGEDIDVEQSVNVRHRRLQIAAQEAARGVRPMPFRQSVVVKARDAGVTERRKARGRAGRLTDYFDHPVAGIINSGAGAGAFREAGIEGHHADDEINKMVRQSCAHPSIRVW